MADNNTIYGWVLAGGIAAIGLSIATGRIYHSEEPEQAGYAVVAPEAGAAAEEGPPMAALLAQGDSANGAKIFNKCTACHTINAGGANGIGPNLHEVVGDAIAQGRGGFGFSDALKSVGGKWTFENLDAWLTSPKRFAPGTKMSFAGLSNPQDRADLMLYLNENGSNLPLPAVPEPSAGDEAAEGEAAEGAAAGEATPETEAAPDAEAAPAAEAS